MKAGHKNTVKLFVFKGQFFQISLVHNIDNLNETKKTRDDDDCMSLDMHGRYNLKIYFIKLKKWGLN